jgi:hypothetical protein
MKAGEEVGMAIVKHRATFEILPSEADGYLVKGGSALFRRNELWARLVGGGVDEFVYGGLCGTIVP